MGGWGGPVGVGGQGAVEDGRAVRGGGRLSVPWGAGCTAGSRGAVDRAGWWTARYGRAAGPAGSRGYPVDRPVLLLPAAPSGCPACGVGGGSVPARSDLSTVSHMLAYQGCPVGAEAPSSLLDC